MCELVHVALTVVEPVLADDTKIIPWCAGGIERDNGTLAKVDRLKVVEWAQGE